jgi:hypothetical protein
MSDHFALETASDQPLSLKIKLDQFRPSTVARINSASTATVAV